MVEALISELKDAVEWQHGGKARFVHAIPVKETHDGQTVWDGVVHVFELTGHRASKLAYAWSSNEEGGMRRFFAVLHMGSVKSPSHAVREVMAAAQIRKVRRT